jgi:TonB-dependent SusC/RagA subfamily outer membrane receptor
MRKLLALLMCIIVAASPGQLHAQTRTITGKITDAGGKPVLGASVVVRGSKAGTTTDADGVFSLTVPASAKAITVTAIGFAPQTASIAGGTINLKLAAADNGLQEVVVVGYGTKPIRENIGAISKIAGTKIAAEPVASFDQALAGKTAGVQVSNGSGILADRTGIRIRGVNSISVSSQPLIVIDGIPQNDKVTNLNGFNGGNGTRFDPLALVNANDIESIDVLKDAGASVLYGSRAANGVILITTKKGKK